MVIAFDLCNLYLKMFKGGMENKQYLVKKLSTKRFSLFDDERFLVFFNGTCLWEFKYFCIERQYQQKGDVRVDVVN